MKQQTDKTIMKKSIFHKYILITLSFLLSFSIQAQDDEAQNAKDTLRSWTEYRNGQVYNYREVTMSDLAKWLSSGDTIADDPVMHFLSTFVVVANLRDSKSLQEQATSFTSFNSTQLEYREMKSIKDISGHSPNFYMPDFGSSMTSAIFVRGFGSMSGTPVVGMNIDNVPTLNKNAFDADLFDVERIEMLRGPQGTTTGRNSMMGVLNVYTLSPFNYQGTRVSADYSTANTIKVKASTYQKPRENFGYSLATNFKHTNGFFTNTFNDEKCDPHNSFSARGRIIWSPKDRFTVDNVLSGGFLKEGGYPYAFTDRNDKTQPISYDGDNSYKRFTISDGLVIQYRYDKFIFNSITGYQYLSDKVSIDPDYTKRSLITRDEEQQEHAVSHEFNFRSVVNEERRWNWKNGLWIFFKHNHSDSPITYHKDGLEELFASNVNAGIQSKYPNSMLKINGDELTVSNDFEIPTFGIAVYHQSEWKFGQWEATVGLRLDYEHSRLDYLSQNDVEYIISDAMKKKQSINTHFYGSESISDFQTLPKFSIQYNFNPYCNLYAYAARGHKAGGFNTLLFSDIIQNKLMTNMLNEVGIDVAETGLPIYEYTDNIAYDAEKSWSFELGGHFPTKSKELNMDFSLFYITCKDQQILTFPSGKNTGCLITNANKSRSLGGELSLNYQHTNKKSHNVFNFEGTYGYTNARFLSFEHDGVSYEGKTIPLAPANTMGLDFQYKFRCYQKWVDNIILGADWKGYGKVYWNEDNLYSQQFYSLFNASVTWEWKKLNVKAWAKNLANNEYNAYSFTNLGNHYCQKGKPRQIGITISYKFE